MNFVLPSAYASRSFLCIDASASFSSEYEFLITASLLKRSRNASRSRQSWLSKGTKCRQIANCGHDVDDRLCQQARHRSTSDVLNRTHKPLRQHRLEQSAFGLELLRPSRIIRRDDYWRLAMHPIASL